MFFTGDLFYSFCGDVKICTAHSYKLFFRQTAEFLKGADVMRLVVAGKQRLIKIVKPKHTVCPGVGRPMKHMTRPLHLVYTQSRRRHKRKISVKQVQPRKRPVPFADKFRRNILEAAFKDRIVTRRSRIPESLSSFFKFFQYG